LNGDTAQAKKFVEKINDWLIDTTGINPNNIHRKKYDNIQGINMHNIAEGYELNGEPIDGRKSANFPVPSFICPFAVSAMVDTKYQHWLNMLWRYIVDDQPKSKKEGNDYFNNTIKMFTMIILSGNYWQPN